jgi:hypothetical protein
MTVAERGAAQANRRLVLVLVCMAQFMVILDATITNVALASLAATGLDRRLAGVLHDAERLGPAAANRGGHRDFRAQLLGRINPERGRRLRERLERVSWEA